MDSIPAEPVAIQPAVPAADLPRRPHLTIRPPRGWVPLDLVELWHFRDLLFALAVRDVKLRYKQTALGIVWVVLQPLLTAGIMAFVFGTVAHMKSGAVPYFIFSYAGQMAWQLFSSVLTKAGGSLVGNAHLISKVFFPRLILPFSSIPSALVDFTIAVAMLGVLMAMYHLHPLWNLLALPLWIGILLMYAIGIGLVATSLMVSYRDVGYVMPVALQILFYASPIAYSATAVPDRLRFWYNLNPMASIFGAIRWSVFGIGTLEIPALLFCAVSAAAVLLFGVFSFKRMEQKFADVI